MQLHNNDQVMFMGTERQTGQQQQREEGRYYWHSDNTATHRDTHIFGMNK